MREYLGDRGRWSYLPRPAEVEVLIGSTGNDASTLAAAAAARARQLLGMRSPPRTSVWRRRLSRCWELVAFLSRQRNRWTGGLVAAALVSVPGASGRGARRSGGLRHRPSCRFPTCLRDGAVAPTTATAMAEGIRTRLPADFGVATTGVAGPDPQEGHPAARRRRVPGRGTRVGLFEPSGQRHDRETVRRQAVIRALDLLRRAAVDAGPGPGES